MFNFLKDMIMTDNTAPTTDETPVTETVAPVETAPVPENPIVPPAAEGAAPTEATDTVPTVTVTDPNGSAQVPVTTIDPQNPADFVTGDPRTVDGVIDDIGKWIRDVDRVVVQSLGVPQLKIDALATIAALEAELAALGGAFTGALTEAKDKLL